MSVKETRRRCAAAVFRSARLVPFMVLAILLALLGGFHAPMAQASSSPTTPMWSTQLDFDNNGTAWSESFFAGLGGRRPDHRRAQHAVGHDRALGRHVQLH